VTDGRDQLRPVRMGKVEALRMTPEAALLTRTFMRRRVPLRAGMYEASFGPPVDVTPDPVRFAVRFGDAAAVATAPRPLVASVLADLDPAAASAPPNLAALLLELALEPELARLEAAAPALAVTLGGSEGSLRLDLDMATAREMARLLERLPLRRAPLPRIPLPLRIRTMAATLTVGQLQTLGEADVVLADALPDSELLVVVGERLAWRARREGHMEAMRTCCVAARCPPAPRRRSPKPSSATTAATIRGSGRPRWAAARLRLAPARDRRSRRRRTALIRQHRQRFVHAALRQHGDGTPGLRLGELAVERQRRTEGLLGTGRVALGHQRLADALQRHGVRAILAGGGAVQGERALGVPRALQPIP